MDFLENPCDRSKCQNGATCQEEDSDSYKCLCPTGFIGASCEHFLCKSILHFNIPLKTDHC